MDGIVWNLPRGIYSILEMIAYQQTIGKNNGGKVVRKKAKWDFHFTIGRIFVGRYGVSMKDDEALTCFIVLAAVGWIDVSFKHLPYTKTRGWVSDVQYNLRRPFGPRDQTEGQIWDRIQDPSFPAKAGEWAEKFDRIRIDRSIPEGGLFSFRDRRKAYEGRKIEGKS